MYSSTELTLTRISAVVTSDVFYDGLGVLHLVLLLHRVHRRSQLLADQSVRGCHHKYLLGYPQGHE